MSLSLQAFAEELFFRAYLMQRLSNLNVSVLFTVPHVILYTDLWSVLTFLPSLLYGYAYQRTGSLVFVSLLHLASNILWLGFLVSYMHSGN
ncbi:CPBP family glutamic-type intramembrane protease [Pampinifervens florentissimum]|uniref:CPBP family glutamic-type intramembrane protease n=1 Tax=Pampinifervens florentissimum TaxID=1632019 RepID=UPI0013B49F47|nr:CPBP family glutamic-type intramembrane protease [Hydrogenobacter sp. T-8]QID33593.1 CPBP family intramembrane metalloprotease [Hydrogenobacter sp. T-8]